LVVWQKAMRVASLAYRLTKGWPAEHRFGIASQIQRSAVSVPSNIAEGYERRSRAEYLRFLSIAAGSLAELETQVRLAAMVGLSPDGAGPLIERIHEVGRIIRGIERSLKAPRTSKPLN
jgi:four helix bundle protein